MELEGLEKEVSRSRYLVYAILLAVPAVYALWFFANEKVLSTSSSDWGTFGDFIGGILNPIMALFAFYWLTRSILIQKKELEESQNALRDSSKSQAEQAKSSLALLHLQKLQIELEAINSTISTERAYINALLAQAATHGTQYTVVTKEGNNQRLDEFLPELNDEIDKLKSDQRRLLNEISALASKT